MLQYRVPLIPSNLCSWIIHISNCYLIALPIGSAVTGMYAMSNKVPNIPMAVANIFMSAQQISALADQPKSEKSNFFKYVRSLFRHCLCDGFRLYSFCTAIHPPSGRIGIFMRPGDMFLSLP